MGEYKKSYLSCDDGRTAGFVRDRVQVYLLRKGSPIQLSVNPFINPQVWHLGGATVCYYGMNGMLPPGFPRSTIFTLTAKEETLEGAVQDILREFPMLEVTSEEMLSQPERVRI